MAFPTTAIPKLATIAVAWLCFAGCTSADRVDGAAAAEVVPSAVTAPRPPEATPLVVASAAPISIPATAGDPAPAATTRPAPVAPAPGAPVGQASAGSSAAAPTAPTAVAPPAVIQIGLPAGEGRETVQRVCGNCHAIDTVTAVGRTPQGWSDIIGQMQNMGLSATDEDLAVVHAYLSRELPPR